MKFELNKIKQTNKKKHIKKGKPLNEALVEIDTSTKAYDWFSEEAKRVYGDIIPSPVSNKKFFVAKQPVGVCGSLTPVIDFS